MKDVSVIFVNYNTRDLTLNAINSVYKFTKNLNFEIIVVDNNSKDDSVKAIREQFTEVNVIVNNKNEGFGRANNIGMEVANSKYYFLLNTDTYLLNNAINVLYNFMERDENKNIGVVGGMLFNENLEPNIYAGYFPRFELFLKGAIWKHFYPKKNEEILRVPIPHMPKKVTKVDYVSGANFFVRSSIINQVGGFDKRFFMYGEDVELSYRILTKAKKYSFIVPEAEIVHISQGSSKAKSESKKFKKQLIISRSIYYKITKGSLAAFLYYITSMKRLYFN